MSEELAPREPWDRKPGEGTRVFSHFCRYRDIGPTRTLAQGAVAAELSLDRVEKLSQQYGWVARAEAYDDYLERKERADREDETLRMNRRHVQLGAMLSGAALLRLAGRSAGVREGGEIVDEIKALDPRELEAGDVARLAEVGFRIERTARGLATDITRSLDMVSQQEVATLVNEIVELALLEIPDDRHEAYIRSVRALGERSRR